MKRYYFFNIILVSLFSCNQSKLSDDRIFTGSWEDIPEHNMYDIDTTNFIRWFSNHSGVYHDMEVRYRILNKNNEVLDTKMNLHGKDYAGASFHWVNQCNIMFIQYKSRNIYDFNMIDGAYKLIKNNNTCPSDNTLDVSLGEKDSLIIDLKKNSISQDFHILLENDSIHTPFSTNRKITFEDNFFKENQCILPAHTAYNRRRCFLKEENMLLEIPVLLYDSDTLAVSKGYYLQSKNYNVISPSILKERTGISFNRNVEYFSLRKKS